MRTLLILGLLAASPVALAAAPAVKIKTLDCFYINDNQVYDLKGTGRYEVGKFRCQAVIDVKGEGARMPVTLELKQKGQPAAGKATVEAYCGPGTYQKIEVELPVPEENYSACDDFNLVLTVGSAKRSLPVKADCPD